MEFTSPAADPTAVLSDEALPTSLKTQDPPCPKSLQQAPELLSIPTILHFLHRPQYVPAVQKHSLTEENACVLKILTKYLANMYKDTSSRKDPFYIRLDLPM